MKRIDSGQVSLGAPATTGTLSLINGVSSGTDETNRTGRYSQMVRYDISVFFEPNTASTSANGDVIRTILLYDAQPNGAAPGVADVLQNNNYTEPYNSDNSDRFLILYDCFVNLEANAYTAGVLTNGTPKFHSVLIEDNCDLETIYSGTGATIASIASGSLYLLFISAYASWLGSYNSRVWFYDK